MVSSASYGEERQRNGFISLLPICLIVFLCYLPIGLGYGSLPQYIGGTLGLGAEFVGLVIGLQSLATVLTRGFAGSISDSAGAKRSIFWGIIALLVSGMLTASAGFAGLTQNADLAVLILGRLALGLAESLILTGALSSAVASVGVQRTGEAMVWVGIALFAGISAGFPLAKALMSMSGFVVEGNGMMNVGLCVISSGLVLAIISIFIPKFPPLGRGKRVPFLKVVGDILPFGLSLGVSTIGYGALVAFLTLDYEAKGWNGAQIAIMGFGASYILTRLFLGNLPDKVGGYKVISVTLPLQALGLGLIWMAGSADVALVGAIVTGAGYALTFPALGVEAVHSAPPQSRGAAMGAYVAFVDIGLAVTGPLGGLLVARTGYPTIFLLGAILCFVALIIAFSARKIEKPGFHS